MMQCALKSKETARLTKRKQIVVRKTFPEKSTRMAVCY